MDNFVIAHSRGAKQDPGPPFADRWRWPVSAAARKAAADAKPSPAAVPDRK